jgi:hypothetical protein
MLEPMNPMLKPMVCVSVSMVHHMMWYAAPERYTSNSSSKAHSTPAMSLRPQRKWLASFSADAPANRQKVPA